MCRIDGAERNDFDSSEVRRARVPHACCECRREIAPGETYLRMFSVYDGHADTYKVCGHCRVAYAWLGRNCGGYILEEAIEELREHAEEYPHLAVPLLRIIAGARRRWRRFNNGGLMPLPAAPPDIQL